MKKHRTISLKASAIMGKNNVVFLVMASLLAAGCAEQKTEEPFDPKRCMQQISKKIDGFKIMDGPRSEKSIIFDMRESECNAQVLFRQISPSVEKGHITFEVTVEYTGETSNVKVVTSNVSHAFQKKVSDFIMDTDFKPWTRHDEPSVFRYTMNFKSE